MLFSFSTVIGSRLLALAGCLSRSEYFCIYWVRAKLSLEAVLRLATKKRGGGEGYSKPDMLRVRR